MKIYLLRHGEALSPLIDPEQPLSPQGKIDIEKIGRFLASKHSSVTHLFHSPKLRTKQTAEILRPYVAPGTTLSEYPFLKPNDSIQPIVERIEDEKESLMVVSHLPFLKQLLRHLIKNELPSSLASYKPGTCVALKGAREGWAIEWSIDPSSL